MSRWDEQFKNHPIHQTLAWARECVLSRNEETTIEEPIEKRRLIKLLNHIQKTLESLDSELISKNQLDAIDGQLRHQNVAPQLEAYKNNGNASHLTNVNDHITNSLTHLSTLAHLTSSETTLTTLKDLENLADSCQQSILKKKAAIETELQDLKNSIETNKAELSKLEGLIASNSTQVNAQIAEWQKQFSTAQEERNSSFTKWRDQFTKEKNSEINDLIQNIHDQGESTRKKFTENLESILADAEKKHEAILDLYQLTAGDSVAAGYLKNANEEKRQADIWRRASIGFILLTVFWMIYSYCNLTSQYESHDINELPIKANPIKSQSVDSEKMTASNTSSSQEAIEIKKDTTFYWVKFLLTFPISGVLLWGSAYSAQQSTKHRKNEHRTRWFALETKAIDPFINSMSPEDQNALKKQLSERMFGQFSNMEYDKTKVLDEHAVSVVLEALFKKFKSS